MRNISKGRFVPTNVLMKFEDGSVSFCIPEGATLADISENLDKVGKWHSKLLSIDVRFKASNDSGFGCGATSVDIVLHISTGPRTGASHGLVQSFSLASPVFDAPTGALIACAVTG